MPTPLCPEKTTLVIARNDGEAVAIIDIAVRLGFDVRISDQPWGAMLEREPASTFLNLKETVIIVEMPGPDKEAELSRGHRLIIIDHHKYPDLERSNPKSSLEQFADLIGYTLTGWEVGVALNDRGYISALVAGNYSPDEIQQIRRFDLVAQGYSDSDFGTLEDDYAKGYPHGGLLYVVTTAQERTSYLADIHYWKHAGCSEKPDILILARRTNGLIRKASLSGRPESAKRLYRGLGGFCGGDETDSMYWGQEYPEPIEKDRLIPIIDKALGLAV